MALYLGQTVDDHEDCEDATLRAAISIVGNGALLTCPSNGALHVVDSAVAAWQIDLGEEVEIARAAFFIRVGTQTVNGSASTIFTALTAGLSEAAELHEGANPSGVRDIASVTGGDGITIANNALYHISMVFANSHFAFSIRNAAHDLVGVVQFDSSYPAIRYLRVGCPRMIWDDTGKSADFDDIVWDTSGETTPLIGYQVETGHRVLYQPNGATVGSAPVDALYYDETEEATVLGNPGNMARPGYVFAGYNTAANGTGTPYSPGAHFPMPNADVTLYAQWAVYAGSSSIIRHGTHDPAELSDARVASAVTVKALVTGASLSRDVFGQSTTDTSIRVNDNHDDSLPCGLQLLDISNQRYRMNRLALSDSVNDSWFSMNGGLQTNFRGNPGYALKFSGFSANLQTIASAAHCAMVKLCYIDGPIDPIALFMAYVAMMEAAESAHPGVMLIYCTIPLTIAGMDEFNPDGTEACNALIRQYCVLRLKPLFDWASLESNGRAVLDSSSRERLDPSASTDGGHLSNLGSLKLAGAWIRMMDLVAQALATFGITYNGNGSTGGSVPVDPSQYRLGSPITVRGNTGVLVRTGYQFSGWNTRADGTGTAYAPDAILSMGTEAITLYAQWTLLTYGITYDGNGATSGTVPVDSSAHAPGATVPLLANTGNLEKAGSQFNGWNEQADGSGTHRAAGGSMSMPASNVRLFAEWVLIEPEVPPVSSASAPIQPSTFDDLLRYSQTAATKSGAIKPAIIGTSIVASEVAARLSPNLYGQLSNEDTTVVTRAAARAALQVSITVAPFGKVLDLDDIVSREIVLLMTIYEMHMALGHEEAGKEYRVRAKDLLVSVYGKFPEANDQSEARPAVGAITVSEPDKLLRRHRGRTWK
jgi:uncharacterized repeat protein (TIGR02543 family)